MKSLTERPWLLDVTVAIVAVLCALGVVVGFAVLGEEPPPTAVSYLLALFGSSSVLVRHKRPIGVLAVVDARGMNVSEGDVALLTELEDQDTIEWLADHTVGRFH